LRAFSPNACLNLTAKWLEESLDTPNDAHKFIKKLSPTKQLQPDSVLVNRYSIQEVIGVGGMGSVYRARDLHFPNMNKLIAFKEMINQATDPLVIQNIVQNFEREAHLLASLSHPSIPKIYDYFTNEERSYLVLEYIQGKDLEMILEETVGFLSEDQVVRWAIELCDVLQYLHDHKPEPIVFRDMKPSNVMINIQNHVVLIDFGIAKIFKSGQKGTMIGTEGYSPPEQYRGESNNQADIYALGATLHHLLTKRDPRLEPPFTFSERPMRTINPAISAEIEAVVNKSLQYSPQDRFESTEEMKLALQNALNKEGDLTPISVRPNASQPVSAAVENNRLLWKFDCEDEIRGSPIYDNGVIYIGSYDHNLYAIRAEDGELIWKFAAEAGIVGKPIIYENNLYFGSEDQRLYAISTRTGKLSWSFTSEGPIRCSPNIAEGHIFFGSDDCRLYAINLISNRKVWATDVSGPIRSSPAISDNEILFGCESGEFFCVDFRGQIRWRFKSKRAITSSPVSEKGIVCFSSLDGMLYALDSKTGWAIWRFRMGKGSISSPSRAENMVFVGSADENIYCLDASNAKELWRFKTDHQVSGSPVVFKDALYCGSADKNVYCLDYRSGHLRWKFSTNGPITGSPAVFDNVVYVGSLDHTLYALKA
jgi:eukaryotic-like serine/threonine-protein kinase